MSALVHRRRRAPQDDGAALIDPPLHEASALVANNRTALAELERRTGLPANLRAAARKWMFGLSGADDQKAQTPLILSGHQPELFHSGVWFKNFVLSAIAKSTGGVGINLVIDNDTIRSAGIRVPTRGATSSEVVSVPFDAAGQEIPWEERPILDRRLFETFATEVRQVFSPLVSSRSYNDSMILDRLWPYASDAARGQSFPANESILEESHTAEFLPNTSRLSLCLTASRLRLEQDLGLTIFDCTLSGVATGATFVAFAASILARHREFHSIHNAALAEFRIENRVRSQTHPVPDLAQYADWFEAPFWIWTAENPHRRRVFVRARANSWEITDRAGVVLQARANDSPAMSRLSDEILRRGIRLRPRALITTMYARLVLSDLFIHGIGGAKYDELTDLIIRRFFGIEPPAYITATATFRLPIDRPDVSLDDVRTSTQRIRDLRYRPESFLRDRNVHDADLSTRLAALAAEKREFLDKHDLRRCSQDVFDQLDRLNRAMHDLLQPVEEVFRARHAELLAQAKQSRLLASREFSFVLFPSEILPARLLDLCQLSS